MVRRIGKYVLIAVCAVVLLLAAALAWAWVVGPPAVNRGEVVAAPVECADNAAPVVVLPGGDGTVGETAGQWKAVTDALRGAGFCALVFQAGVVDGNRWAGDVPAAAADLGAYIADVRKQTGAAKVAFVAHSAGSVVADYYLKVLHGAPDVDRAVFIAPETARCDGAGFARAMGLPAKPFPVFRAVPAIPALLGRAVPAAAGSLQIAPGSKVFARIFESGRLSQPGVAYSVIATSHDQFATPAPTCSFIEEPGVTNVLYDGAFPGAAPVDHSTIRSSPDTARWVVARLGAED
ncbi:hypothetical protein P0W64_13020 [Tsukamurella sp. 8F]|uniref:esterase/lipase family protein n=1 Tax=unclassified Tsukamurella TaxID=2633480 RepID=UPI0023B99225|nr:MULTISPECIES: hypothetical protein [unclassified Tsukamurella]MDF0530482.1 hypothetical protein [Tsukamurella sp. 8J]MDF0587697.1 hypothetical protein [Tsukamurella sp. 8F]